MKYINSGYKHQQEKNKKNKRKITKKTKGKTNAIQPEIT
jgi:hypothetical protein